MKNKFDNPVTQKAEASYVAAKRQQAAAKARILSIMENWQQPAFTTSTAEMTTGCETILGALV